MPMRQRHGLARAQVDSTRLGFLSAHSLTERLYFQGVRNPETT